MEGTSTSAAKALALKDIAMSTASTRQIRDVLEADVLELVQTDPKTWDPITVRPWPAGEAYPVGEEGRPYQLVAGYHRLSAARRMGLKTIKGIVREDLSDDTAFLLVALNSNLRHGKQMRQADKVAALQALMEQGMSLGELAKATGIPKATLSNWLTGRDTNTARQSRDATSRQQVPPPEMVVPANLQVITPSQDAKAIATFRSAWSDLGLNHSSVWTTPADVVAGWLMGLSPDDRLVARDIAKALSWLTSLQTALAPQQKGDAA